MKKLVIDCETSPNLAYIWGLWNQNVGLNQIEKTGSVISRLQRSGTGPRRSCSTRTITTATKQWSRLHTNCCLKLTLSSITTAKRLT